MSIIFLTLPSSSRLTKCDFELIRKKLKSDNGERFSEFGKVLVVVAKVTTIILTMWLKFMKMMQSIDRKI